MNDRIDFKSKLGEGGGGILCDVKYPAGNVITSSNQRTLIKEHHNRKAS